MKGMWTREDGAKFHGVFISTLPQTGQGEEEAAHTRAEQIATALGVAVHDGTHWVWPPTSQRENSASLHQLRLEPVPDSAALPGDAVWGVCSCGWSTAQAASPAPVFSDWENHLLTEGVL